MSDRRIDGEADFYEHSFGYLCTYSRDLQVSFRTVKVELDFFRMKRPKSSHISVLNFVTFCDILRSFFGT